MTSVFETDPTKLMHSWLNALNQALDAEGFTGPLKERVLNRMVFGDPEGVSIARPEEFVKVTEAP